MAGGSWTAQNKKRPGVYINFESEPAPLAAVGVRGVASIALPLSWGVPKAFTVVQAGQNAIAQLGYSLSDARLLLVREALKRAKTLLVYRLNTGAQAAVTLGNLTATARYGGTRGNDIAVAVDNNVDQAGTFVVRTLLDGVEVDRQTAAGVESLSSNDWVTFAGAGALAAAAGAPLAGGTDGSVANADHTDYLAALELLDFDTVALASGDAALKGVYAAFAKRLRDEEGKKIQAVLENFPAADHEGVVSVKNGVKLADGTVLSAAQATAWVAGALAGALPNESLTYTAYEDAVDTGTRYTNSQIEAALAAGEFLFTPRGGGAVVEQDINSLTGFTPAKGRSYAKNRVVRVLDTVHEDIKGVFETYYLGKVNNNEDGRALLRSECVAYLNRLQNSGAIDNFNPQTDIAVTQGESGDSVLIETHLQPVDAVEKIYMKVQVG